MFFRILVGIAGSCLLMAGPAGAQGKIELQWFAHSAFKLTTQTGKVIMIDPWITTNPKVPPELKDLDKLGKVDLVLVTHGHADHFGNSIEIAKKNKVQLWSPGGMNHRLRTLGLLPPEQLPNGNVSGTINPFPGVKITQVHAEHSSELNLKDPGTGKETTYSAGSPVGFIIELENGFKIYHMGDTGLFGDMKFIADYYKPDLILIPIGGGATMDPRDAAFATREWLKPKMALPIHYGTIPYLKGTPAEFKAALGQTSVKVLDDWQPGQAKEF